MTATPVFNSARFEPARREAAAIAEGRAIIAKRFGAATFKKCFGVEPPRTMAPPAKPSPTAATTPKHYSTEAGPFQPRKLHCFVNRAWLP